MWQGVLDQLRPLGDDLVHQSAKHSYSCVALLVFGTAEEERQLCVLCIVCVSLQLVRQKDRQHRLALARPAGDPQQARVAVAVAIAIAVTITVAVQPGAVARIACDPLARARDSRAFRADYAFAVYVGIGEEERLATRDGRFVRSFWRAGTLVGNHMVRKYPVRCTLGIFGTCKVHISRRTYEGLRAVLSGDPTDVLMVGQGFRHLARLPATLDIFYSTVLEIQICAS